MNAERKQPSGEDRLIDRFFRPIAKHPGALNLLDDAACITPPEGHDLVLTVDASVAGVHFFASDPADLVAKKSLRMNLSDLAAKGAKPLGILLSLSLPEPIDEAWLESFARGLGEDCAAYRCPLLGGDTTRTGGAATISITALGTVPGGTMVKRGGARPGDFLVVTGTIGDAALGLKLRKEPAHPAFGALDAEAKAHLSKRYLLPQPRNPVAEALRGSASAAIDLSDGLAGDVAKLADASGVAAQIDAAAVPLSDAARAVIAVTPELFETAVTGGDDYEIAAAVPQPRVASLAAACREAGIGLTTIGRIEAGSGVNVTGSGGQPMRLKRASFSHF